MIFVVFVAVGAVCLGILLGAGHILTGWIFGKQAAAGYARAVDIGLSIVWKLCILGLAVLIIWLIWTVYKA